MITNNLRKIKKAFTLAEALIVVAVIGVIAALTIPAVVNNYQKDAFATHLKKIANDFTNAATVVTVNKGKPSFIKSGVFCLSSSATLCPGNCKNCDPFMEEYMEAERQDNIFSNSYRSIKGSISNFNCEGKTYRLPSGASVCMTQKSATKSGGSYGFSKPYFQIDIDLNGTAAPNISGRDYFKMFIDYKGKVSGTEDIPSNDSEIITNCIADNSTCPEWNADVNGDGEITIADADVNINSYLDYQDYLAVNPVEDDDCIKNSKGLYCFSYLQQHNWKMDY